MYDVHSAVSMTINGPVISDRHRLSEDSRVHSAIPYIKYLKFHGSKLSNIMTF